VVATHHPRSIFHRLGCSAFQIRQANDPEVLADAGDDFLRGEEPIRLQDRTFRGPPSRLDVV
jgi:hypothetical protein